MDCDSVLNISIESDLEDSDIHSNECPIKNSGYVTANSASFLNDLSKDKIEEVHTVLCHHMYTRDQLFECSFSNICLQPPPNWEKIKHIIPQTILKKSSKIETPKVKSSQLEKRSWRMEKMAKRNEFAWKNEYMADCSLLVGEEEKEFPCHKYFLCLASAVLEDLLKDASDEHPKIFLPDIDPTNFHKVLEYIYKNNIKRIKHFAVIQSIWITANKLGIISLVQFCVTYARHHVYGKYALSGLQFARLINDEDFEQFCLQYIQENTAEVLKATNWYNIEQRTLETLLKLETMHETCELDLFKACLKWANMNTPPDGSKRETLGPLISLLRFLAIKIEDFASTVCPTKLLTPEEMVAIFCCLVTGARDMPAGFSIESSPRGSIVSLDILEVSKLNTSSSNSEVPFLVQIEQVKFREPAEVELSSAIGNDKITEVVLNQATQIPLAANSQFQMGRTHAIKFPLCHLKSMPNRSGKQIMQSPLTFSVSSVAYIFGVQLIPWRLEKPYNYMEKLQVTLTTDDKPKIVATFVGCLQNLNPFTIKLDNPVYVQPDTIYKLNVIYSDSSIKHCIYLLSLKSNVLNTSFGMKLTIHTTEKHYTNIRALYFREILHIKSQ